MKKESIVRSNRDFDDIIKNGKFVKNSDFVIYYKNNNINSNRFGISVGKKIGNAVTRNYYKRVIRNICDKNKNLYSNSKDYIIIMRNACSLLNYNKMNESYVHLISKIEKENKNEKTI